LAFPVPLIQEISPEITCIRKEELASAYMQSASNTRFSIDQIEKCSNTDWLTIYQDHSDKAGKLRKIHSGLVSKMELHDLMGMSEDYYESYIKENEKLAVKWRDGNTYKPLWESFSKYLVEGSHSTRVMLFCDGTRVFLSGNIGRFGRSDNLFNLKFKETIAKANEILKMHGLPPFTEGKSTRFWSQLDGKIVRKRESGAVITRVDINVNFATGSPENAQYLVDYLQARSLAHVSKSVSGRTSVQWGRKGGRLFTKAYVKHEEMFSHCKVKDREALLNSFAYQYARDNGIVRIETEIDRKTLLDTELRDLENVTMRKLCEFAKGKIDQLLDDIPEDLNHFEPQKIFNKKEHRKYLKTLGMWKAGMDLMNFNSPVKPMSKSTFYEHRNAILEIAGIDISQRYIDGVTNNVVSLVSQITLEPLECPEDYDVNIDLGSMPELNIIDLTKHLPKRDEISRAMYATQSTAEFLATDLTEPNHEYIVQEREKAKEKYKMAKLYEIHKDNNSHRLRGFS